MQFSILRSLPEVQALAGEWNALLQTGASAVPFLRHEYLTTWWQTLGGGEWPAGELCVVTARGADGALVGVAPLFFAANREGLPALLLLGSVEISDYLDLIAAPQDLPDFVSGLFELLAGPQAPAWQVLDLYNLLETSPTLAALDAAAEGRGWRVEQEALQHCPYIRLPGDFEQYLAEQVDKKQRHEIRRKMRRAEESGQPVRWYIVDSAADLEAEMGAFLALMAQDPEKARFLTPAMRQQMRLSLIEAQRCGYLQLSFLEVGGQKAAAYLNFDYENTLWVYNSGLDFSFRELSPGWVLLGYLLQWANQNGRAVFDFMRGDEEYKYRFGAIDRRVLRVQITRPD